ncbi:Glycosyl transferases group 1 [Mesorhizobium albiziae]|uniref:Glycosyl transferases group 1 n=1 Tax=Neomesorhizobium albiziae TaxID=335020 RepID=A0A1I4B4U0_9HYPH|nr:glycosyltransferase [Mesorhizobium albiziae]GLS34341.1 glycosyl transferase [Mesorhizobium albiziae]SFK63922.1 Glycosyl transferases group 1 [Mesorhizobium albiziae]
MHLVFATSIVPHAAPATGYEIANAAIIDALRRAGVRVTVLGYAWPGKEPSDPENTVVLGAVDVRTENASLPQKIEWLGKAMAAGLTFSSIKLRAATPDNVKAALRAIGPYDGYVINAVQLAGAFEGLFADKPSIFVAHNVEFRSAEENAESATGLLQKFLYRREARLLKGIEARLCANASFVWTLADEDRQALGVEGNLRSAALPLVTRLAPPPAPSRREIVCDAALVGTWTWQPNRIGLDWFLESVVPLLPGDFRIHIAGHLPAGLSSRHPGVSFVGRVPDATEFVRGAAVIPLISRAGTGVQLKSIETFELGLPAVATTRSLRGIDRIPENCVVADEAEEFAEALLRLAKHGAASDVDGRDFYRRQRDALDAQVRLGLVKIGAASRQAAA